MGRKDRQRSTIGNFSDQLLWGVGYVTEVNYLVPRVTIPGKGTFTNVRFEARPEKWDRAGEWKWKRNPFIGRPEFQGLKIMMAMINNWDLKDSNNVIVNSRWQERCTLLHHQRSRRHLWSREHNAALLATHPEQKQSGEVCEVRVLEKVKGDRVVLHFGGKNRGLMKDITVHDAQWIGGFVIATERSTAPRCFPRRKLPAQSDQFTCAHRA